MKSSSISLGIVGLGSFGSAFADLFINRTLVSCLTATTAKSKLQQIKMLLAKLKR